MKIYCLNIYKMPILRDLFNCLEYEINPPGLAEYVLLFSHMLSVRPETKTRYKAKTKKTLQNTTWGLVGH